MKKILVIKAHTISNSFCNALTDNCIKGYKEKENEVKVINLVDLNLEQFLKYKHTMIDIELPNELEDIKKLIKDADHLTFTYPTWWATPPAILKLFFEIVFHNGFAFRYQKSNGMFPKWDKLLQNKTVSFISTMDSPPFYMNWIVGDPGGKMMKDIINFTGMKLVGKYYFGSVKTSTLKQREKWLNECYKIGLNELA